MYLFLFRDFEICQKVCAIKGKKYHRKKVHFQALQWQFLFYLETQWIWFCCKMCQPNMIYYPSNASYPFQLNYLIKIFFEVYKNLFQFFILSMLMGRYKFLQSLESLVRPVFGYLIKLSRCLHFVNLCYAWSLCMHFGL